MRLPIAIKIFGITGFLAAVMVAAAVMSEIRVREANQRVHALANYLVPISDFASSFRAITLEEEIHFRHIVALLTLQHREEPLNEDVLKEFEGYQDRLATLIAAMNAQLETALLDMKQVSDRLSLTRLKGKFDEVVDEHGHVHEIVERIIVRHQTGVHHVVGELIDVYKTEQIEFDQAQTEVVKEIQAFVHSIAKAAEKDEEAALFLNRVVTLDFSRPGKPTDNAFVESFNGKVRAECIDQNWFLSLDDARSKCEAYRREHNEERPHSAIGNKTPMEFIKTIGHPSHPMV